jgi:TrmH family RNA methyltransferase
LHEGLNLPELLPRLRIPLLATALGPGAQSLYKLALPRHAAWVAGNEGQGVDPELLMAAQTRVFIPQEPAVESLNVAIATAICLFEQRRQWLGLATE